jgi:hypothetical protein
MRMRGKLFMAYFPFVLVSGQFIINVLYLLGIDNEIFLYYSNALFGTNLGFAVFLVCYTQFFHFCRISKWSAFVEVLLALDVMIVRDETTYNLVFQSIILFAGIILTLLTYANIFPTCLMSLHALFIKKIIKNKFDCVKSLEDYKNESYKIHLEKYSNHGRKPA